MKQLCSAVSDQGKYTLWLRTLVIFRISSAYKGCFKKCDFVVPVSCNDILFEIYTFKSQLKKKKRISIVLRKPLETI